MKAWQVVRRGEPRDALELVDLDAPEPGPDEVRIRVAATGIGLPDLFMCRGSYPLTPALPFVPGQEAAGVVTAAGVDVDLSVGTRVMGVTAFTKGQGGFAEETLIPAANAFTVPEGLDDAEAAGFWIPHLTAWIGLVDRGQIAVGDWLVVLGAAGSSGIAAVRLGRALGARVVAVVGSEEKAAFCTSLGADVAIDHRGVKLSDAIREATGGHGADLVYDPVGGEVGAQSARALARGGRLLAEGFASGSWPQVDVHVLVRTNASLVGVFAGGHTRAELEAIHTSLAALVDDGSLGPAVTAVATFADLPAAVQAVADRAVVGKSVVLGPR